MHINICHLGALLNLHSNNYFLFSPKKTLNRYMSVGAFFDPKTSVHASHVDTPSHTYYYQKYNARLRCLRSQRELRLNSKTGALNKQSLLRERVTSRTRVLF